MKRVLSIHINSVITVNIKTEDINTYQQNERNKKEIIEKQETLR
jgi:hypothetical protein